MVEAGTNTRYSRIYVDEFDNLEELVKLVQKRIAKFANSVYPHIIQTKEGKHVVYVDSSGYRIPEKDSGGFTFDPSARRVRYDEEFTIPSSYPIATEY